MSTFPAAAEVSPLPGAGAVGLNVPRSAVLAVLLAILGLSTIWSSMHSLWAMWTGDALKSIGMFVPLVSLVLILRVWRSLGWEMDGSWWGLAILVATAAVVQMRDRSILILVLSPQWQISLPPPPLVVFAYGAGVVLLFGGSRLFRAALFPLVLLFFVNPVPHIFNTLIDLPLQRASAHVARSYAYTHGGPFAAQMKAEQDTPGQFPARIGRYTLSRTWNENFFTGPLIYHWAHYVEEGGGSSISIGISPVLGAHDTLICHTARGEDPLWRDQLTLATAGNVPVDFSGSFFNDGATQYLEATTVCNGRSCGERSSEGTHIGFIYSKPDAHTLLTQEPQRPIPILLKAETIDTTLPAEVARQQLMTAMRSFLSSVDLDGLTQPYRHQ